MVQQAQPIAINQAQPMVQPAGQMQSVESGTSIWKKWWLWMIIAIVVGGGVYYFFF